MIIPVPTHTDATPVVDPQKELKVALRLLSGKDCTRDASAAQVMLLRLAEGSDTTVAEDANHVLKAGAARDWFGETAPHHFELERIAERSLAKKGNRQQLILMLIAGLVAMLGVSVFMFAKTQEWEGLPIVFLAIVILAGGGLALARKHGG